MSQIHHGESERVEDRSLYGVLKSGKVRERKHGHEKRRDQKEYGYRQAPARRRSLIESEQGIIKEKTGTAEIADQKNSQYDPLNEILTIGAEKIRGRSFGILFKAFVDRIVERRAGYSECHDQERSEHETGTEQYDTPQFRDNRGGSSGWI